MNDTTIAIALTVAAGLLLLVAVGWWAIARARGRRPQITTEPQYRLRLQSAPDPAVPGRVQWALQAEKIRGSGYWSADVQEWSVRFADGDVVEGGWTFDFRGASAGHTVVLGSGWSDSVPVGGWARMRPYGILSCRRDGPAGAVQY